MKYSTKTERFVQWAIGGLASCLLAVTALGQAAFTQSAPITITDNSKATPYPSTNFVQNTFGLLMSLNMLIETPGGFDYTGADCIGWMKEAGFKEAYVEHLVGPDSMVVGIK